MTECHHLDDVIVSGAGRPGGPSLVITPSPPIREERFGVQQYKGKVQGPPWLSKEKKEDLKKKGDRLERRLTCERDQHTRQKHNIFITGTLEDCQLAEAIDAFTWESSTMVVGA